MNLYLLTQTEWDWDYDTYDSCVVAAQSEDDARLIPPAGSAPHRGSPSWPTHPDRLAIQLIGVADPTVESGVVLASFNAG